MAWFGVNVDATSAWWQLDPEDPIARAVGDLTAWPLGPTLDVPDTISPSGEWFRPPTSFRTVYRPLASTADPDAPAGVLAVKGSEPLVGDFDRLPLAMLTRTFRSDVDRGYASMLEHFPLRERKVPASLTRHEARGEIESAIAVQRDHLAAFGTLARLPVPLVAVDVPVDRQQHVATLLASMLSPRARSIIDELLHEPLTILVSFHPGLPHRVSALDHTLADDEVEQALERWIELSARLLALGYLPHTFQSEGLGSCLDPGNACVDGSVCDPDSIRPLSDLTHLDDGTIYDAISSAFLAVVRLAGLVSPGTVEWSTGHDLLRAYVRRRFVHHLDVAAAVVGDIDPRVTTFFGDLDHRTVVEMIRSRRRSNRSVW